MAKRKSAISKSNQELGIINLEHPESYKPWIHARELSSGSGKRHIFPDIYYPERMIHLMSNLEKRVYYKLRQNSKVLELFEQVPLELASTIRICEELNIEHPKIPFTEQVYVMTTDFVAYVDLGGERTLRAYAIKMEKELEDERVLNKFRIEQAYWKEKNIQWEIITEKDI